MFTENEEAYTADTAADTNPLPAEPEEEDELDAADDAAEVDELDEADADADADELDNGEEEPAESGTEPDDTGDVELSDADAGDAAFNRQTPQLSEQELDEIADAALDVLRGILKYFDAEDAKIDEYEGDEGELIFDIVGESLAVLIGRHGKTLDALQFLVSSIVTKQIGIRHPIIVDIEGYKHRRKQKLQEIAKSSAARAIRQKREVRLHPMTPYERRIVHITLREDRRVTTASEGEDPNRQIIIKPV
jgi:spoIIIJ-associated protein